MVELRSLCVIVNNISYCICGSIISNAFRVVSIINGIITCMYYVLVELVVLLLFI